MEAVTETVENFEHVGVTPTQLDRIEAMLDELIEAKHQLEAMAESLQGKGPMALMSMFK